jgi:hypothetical protein
MPSLPSGVYDVFAGSTTHQGWVEDQCTVSRSGSLLASLLTRLLTRCDHASEEIGAALQRRAVGDGASLYVYKCFSASYGTEACPGLVLGTPDSGGGKSASETQMALADGYDTMGAECHGNHTGRLCAICQEGFSRKTSDNSCVSCTDSHWKSNFGMSFDEFIVFVVITLACVIAFFRALKDDIKRWLKQGATCQRNLCAQTESINFGSRGRVCVLA